MSFTINNNMRFREVKITGRKMMQVDRSIYFPPLLIEEVQAIAYASFVSSVSKFLTSPACEYLSGQ